MQPAYVAIDLKSFFASVECVERGLDPLCTNLVVADKSRTEKTICLAVTPSLKAYGISGRARLFEVVQRVRQENWRRRQRIRGHSLTGTSCDARILRKHPQRALAFHIASPHMKKYMEFSSKIYSIYLRYVSPDDIHVYSIDEVFIDLTRYLKSYKMSARELTMTIIRDVLRTTGITATAGIGTNLYLCKIAMDIVAKHIAPDRDGVRIAELDEASYRRHLWSHRPITDFWRVGRGYAKRLEAQRLYTMGDIARCSVGRPDEYYNEELLYRMFGINAELLIDHAWGHEPCTIEAIKKYRPSDRSICSGQVLHSPYTFDKARIVVREMTEAMSLALFAKGLSTDKLDLTVGFDIENVAAGYDGETVTDRYGRTVPKHAHGLADLGGHTASTRRMTEAVMALYDRIIAKNMLVRRINLTACHVCDEAELARRQSVGQLSLFGENSCRKAQNDEEKAAQAREKQMQSTLISIHRKYGKNALLKGLNFEEGATGRSRNRQVGGHRA